MKTILDVKGLENVCKSQSNRLAYLGLDLAMCHLETRQGAAVCWRIHDTGYLDSVIKEIIGTPDNATMELISYIAYMCLPENR